ncbi:MAG: hypothetical protein ABIO06_09245 [Pseudolysinimonas sp.]
MRRHEAGETAQFLDEFDVSKTAPLSILWRNNIGRGALTDEQIADLTDAYEAGKTIAALEAHTGLNGHGASAKRPLPFRTTDRPEET